MSSDNIKVVVRARPLKKCDGEFLPWIIDEKKIYQIDEDNTPVGDTYSYDEVFNVNTKNVDIYNTAIYSLVSSAIEGINLTIFAYGATSSGKTYTMNGIPDDPGIIPRFIEDIFDQVEFYSQRKFLIRVSYVEIYSEIINDLLDKTNKDLKIREDINNCVSYNPKEQIVKSTAECMNVMKMGAYNRTVGGTLMNQCSSRSHAIFRIVIESAPTVAGENDPVQVSHVNLIDLAGSERVSQTGATGQRFKEGAHINKSLTTLGLVMKQLVEKNEYVNFRDSKLTRILSNSLGGNAKTLVICNINLESLEDTASTLMFAQRAKAVKNKPKVNEVMTEAALTKMYAKECAEIKKLLESEFEKNKQLEVEREISNKKISELDSRIKSLQEIFVKKDPVIRPPKRRHTFCTLGAISEERELENASTNLITVGLRGEGDISGFSAIDSTISPPRQNSCLNHLESVNHNNKTPTKNLRDRLEILTREHEKLIEYTRLEKFENQAMTSKFEQFKNEFEDLKLLAETRDLQLKLEHEKAEQMKIDYEFLLETQKKKFERREKELLEQINKSPSKTETEQTISIENLPLPNTLTLNTFEYEEMSEKIASSKKQIEEMQNDSEKLRLENEGLNVVIADLRKSVNTLELQNSQLKIKNKSLQTKVLDMELKVNNSEQIADLSNNDIESLQKQILRLEENNKELKTELGKNRDELYESQDKLIEVTEDLDIEEKKSANFENQLKEEKKLRQNAEKDLSREIELRKDAESEAVKERLLRQEIESELVKERSMRQETESNLIGKTENELGKLDRELLEEIESRQENESQLIKEISWRQEVDSELINERLLRQEAESELVKERLLKQEAESKLVKAMKLGQDSEVISENQLRKDVESKLVEEIELRQKLELELIEKEEILRETETRYFEEVELRKEIKQTLYTLQNILDPRSQNDSPTEKSKMIILNKPKESVSEYKSVKDTSEIMSESCLDMSDAETSLNYTTPNGSMQEIDSDNLSNFSLSYFKDSSKSNNFMNFFNSFVNNDNEATKQKQNIQGRNDEEQKYECSTNELEKLRKDLNSMKLQRESDILTINKLQAQLDEYGYMNLSDSEKINKANKILGVLKSLEAEKAENLSVIQKLKEQLQNNAVKFEELQNILKITSDDLMRKNEEILKLQEVSSQEDESSKKCIESNDPESFEKKKLEKKLDDLYEKNNLLNRQIETQKTDIEKYLKTLKDKETEVEEMNKQIQEKDTIIKRINEERINTEDKMKIPQVEKHNLEKSTKAKSNAYHKCHDISSDQEINMQNLSNRTEITEEGDKILPKGDEEEREDLLNIMKELKNESVNPLILSEDNEKIIARTESEKNNLDKENNDLLDKIKELKNEIENLSIDIQDKDKIIAIIDLVNIEVQKQANDLSDKINDLTIQVQTQSYHINELSEIIEKERSSEENEMLKNEYEHINFILKEEREETAEFATKFENSSLSELEKDMIIMNLSKENSDLEEKITKLLTKMNDLYSEIEPQRQMEKLSKPDKEEDLMENIKQLKSEIENLSIVIQDKDEIIANIDSERMNLQKQVNDLSDKINDSIQVQTQTYNVSELSEIKEKDLSSEGIERENVEMKEENEVLKKKCEQIDIILKEEIKKNSELAIVIQDKDKIIASLVSEKVNLQKQANCLSDEICDLTVQVQAQTYDISELSEIIGKELCSEETEKENEVLKKEREHIDFILKEEMTKNAELTTDSQNKYKIIASIDAEKLNLQKQANDLSDKINDLSIQIETQTHSISELSEIIEKELSSEEIKNENKEMKKENEMLKTEREQIDFILKEEMKKSAELTTIIQNKDTIIANIDSEKLNLQKQVNDLSDKINDLAMQVKTQTHNISELSEIIEKELSSEEIEKENEELKNENEEVKKENEVNKKENIVLKKEREQIDFILKEEMKKSAELTTIIQNKDTIIANIDSEKRDLQKQVNDLSDKINDLAMQVKTQTHNIGKLSEIIEKELSSEEIEEELKKENEELKNENEEVKKENEVNKKENIELKKEREQIDFILKEEMKKNAELTTIIQDKDKIIASIDSEKLNLQKEANDLSGKINNLSIQVQTQTHTISELSEIIEKGLSSEETEKENEVLKKEYEQINSMLKEERKKTAELTIIIKDKDKIIAMTKSEKNDLVQDKKSLCDKINNLMTQVQTQTNHVAQLNKIIEEKELSSQKILRESEALKKEHNLIQTTLKEEGGKNVDLASNIEIHKIEYEKLLLAVEEKEKIIKQTTAEKMDLEEQRNDLSVKINDLLIQIEEQDRKLKRQNELLEDKELDLQKLSKNYEEFKKENKENEFLLKSEMLQQEDLLKDIEDLKMENAKLSLTICELSNLNSEKINEIRNIEKWSKKEKDIITCKMKDERIENEKEKQKLLSQINNLGVTVETQLIKIKELQEILNNSEIHIKKLENYNQELEQDIKKRELLLTKEKEQALENDDKSIYELKRENMGLMEGLEVLQNIRSDLEKELFFMRGDFSEKLGDHIAKIKSLLGIEEEKTLRSWKIQQKLESKWEDLKKIEKHISTILKGSSANTNYKTKLENAERINNKLTSEIQSLEDQKKFLQMTVENIKKERELAIFDCKEKLEQVNNKLKTMYVSHENDKKKIENLEYELRIISRKAKALGNLNHNSEKDGCELKSSEDKWKQQRAEAHDSRRSIDLNTLCSESTVFRCKCEDMDKKLEEMKSEISKLKDLNETFSLKYEKAKNVCRIRNEEIGELKEKLKKFTGA